MVQSREQNSTAWRPELLDFLERLIAIPSVSGDEAAALRFLEQYFTALGWKVRRIAISPEDEARGRWNLFVVFGKPRLVFTTHVDVVPAEEELFKPRREGDLIIGRGACDAKGILACMVFALRDLVAAGFSDLGLLVVVGEEVDGCGAKAARVALADEGIEQIVNGEPTEGKLALAHKGGIVFRLSFSGKSAHSGYPELGDDANLKLLRAIKLLEEADFGSDSLLGRSSINFGLVQGGVATNVISAKAQLACSLRTVGELSLNANAREIALVRQIAEATEGGLEILANSPPVRLDTVPGFDTAVMAYASDCANFLGLSRQMFLLGPGSIHVAHTRRESISLGSLESGVRDYLRLARTLRGVFS